MSVQAESGEIELDIDELDPHTLFKLYQYVSKHAPQVEPAYRPPPPPPLPVNESKPRKASTAKPRKNKPMSATEQEEKIRLLQAQVHQFDNPGATPQGMLLRREYSLLVLI